MEYGVLAHNAGPDTLSELPRKIREKGFRYVQLALSKAITDIDFSLHRLSPGLANKVAEEFDKHGVRIPVLGCYIDMVHPDEEQYRHGVERFKEHIRMARHFGAAMIASETGFETPQYSGEKAWERMRRTVEELLEEAEKWGTIVAIEPCNGQIIHTAEQWQRLSEEAPSSNLGALLDPNNILNGSNFHRQDEVIRDAFERMGNRIVLCHAKDKAVNPDGSLREVCAGKGVMNYPLFMELLRKHKPYVDISLEAVAPEEMEDALRFMKSFG